MLLETLRVSGHSRPNSVAGAVAALLRSQGQVEVQAIGPAAVNQAVKALAITRGYLAAEGLDLTVQPAFTKLASSVTTAEATAEERTTEERTALTFRVFAYKIPS